MFSRSQSKHSLMLRNSLLQLTHWQGDKAAAVRRAASAPSSRMLMSQEAMQSHSKTSLNLRITRLRGDCLVVCLPTLTSTSVTPLSPLSPHHSPFCRDSNSNTALGGGGDPYQFLLHIMVLWRGGEVTKVGGKDFPSTVSLSET